MKKARLPDTPQQALWRAAHERRDASFDGVFFICVRTTGIYCRPICPARMPNPENVSFVATANEARAAGYRACLRCRPDAAPKSPAWIGTQAVIQRAIRLIEAGTLDGETLDVFAERFGIGTRHFRRLFVMHAHQTPHAYAQATRVRKAQHLLADKSLSLADIAADSGFKSVRRFQAVMKSALGRTPRDVRRTVRSEPENV
jgi:methylphosphotriester-DNA--protein-cysteine methyltransferase